MQSHLKRLFSLLEPITSPADDMAPPTFHSYFFPDDLSSLQPVSVCFFLLVILTSLTQFLQGSLTLLQKPFCFAGYLVVGPRPILYALYVSIICVFLKVCRRLIVGCSVQ